MRADPDDERLERYRKTLRRAWRRNGDSNVWPVKLNAAMHLFAKEFGEELVDDLAWLEAHGRTLPEIASRFYNPARPYRMIDVTLYSMRRNRRSLADQRAVALKMLAMTKALKYGSEFNEDGRNVIYHPVEVESIASAKLGQPVSRDEAELLHRFCGLLWAYTESILFRAHDVTKEFHGPYTYGADGKRFIVKEYLNLRPVELWPNVPLLPCNRIKLFVQYKDPIRIRIEWHNRLYFEGGALVPSLESCALEIDGERRDIAALADYLPSARRTIAAISEHVDALTWNERVMKYAEIFWFRKKPLSDARGRDWRVPEQVRNAIRGGAEDTRRRVPLSGEASERLATLII